MLINDLSPKITFLRDTINGAISRVLNRSRLVLGPEVNAFEKAFAAYLSVNYCRTVANGTDALEFGLRAVGIQQGDKVATIANAGFYTSTALLAIGAIPLYLDVDLETQLVSKEEVKRAIFEGARCIVVTHLYGRGVSNIAEIATFCRAANVFLLEDCAQAHGVRIQGKQAGSFGDIGCFSFYPTKNLGALGDGGAIVCHDSELAEKVSQLRQYGWSTKYQIALSGARNSRLDEIQAAILLEFLPYLDDWNTRRREIAAQYSTRITYPEIILPPIGKEDYVAHLYVIRSTKRDMLREHLKKQGIATDVHYPIPDHRQPVFGDSFSKLHLPHTEMLAQEILTLPCYPEMSQNDVERVINAVNTMPEQLPLQKRTIDALL